MPNAGDTSRPAATNDDTAFILSLEDVSQRYATAGHARTIRSLQRYYVVGHLDCQKVATMLGDKYLVTPQSVARHISQIEELKALDAVATNRALSRLVATTDAAVESQGATDRQQTTGGDTARPGPPETTEVSRYVVLLEREAEQAKDERDFLREQIDRKDKTIDALIERDRETNYLVRGLQEMLTPLLGAPRREPPSNQPT
jgi:hypothetical protein